MASRSPVLTLLAGPNGAGKTSAAPALLAPRAPLERFVNADLIALALDPADPWARRQDAGRVALERVAALEQKRLDFALETTLSGRWTTRLIDRLLASGWTIELFLLWLPSAHAAIERVRERAARRLGHFVPDEDVRRRFTRGLVNLELLRPIVTSWMVVDARDITALPEIARGSGSEITIHRPDLWPLVVGSIREAQRATAGRESPGDDHTPEPRSVREPVARLGSTPADRTASKDSAARDRRQSDRDDPELCFIAANRDTVLRHRRLGAPLLVWRDGRMTAVDPWQIDPPEVPAQGKIPRST